MNRKVLILLILLIGIVLISGCKEISTNITIASWNIQNFGKKKASDDAVMTVIADVLSRFDVIAIQEISNLHEMSDPGCPRNEKSCPGHANCDLIRNALNDYLNTGGRNYKFLFSPQIRDERYLFIYDADTVDLIDSGHVVIDLGDDPRTSICDLSGPLGNMSRQPFYATFKSANFDFTLMTAHTSPSRNMQELSALHDFYRQVQDGDPNENDIILLGDLNADGSYITPSCEVYFEIHTDSFPHSVITCDMKTNVAGGKSYDKIILYDDTYNYEYIRGSAAVYKQDITKSISDHYLVWATFQTNKPDDDP